MVTYVGPGINTYGPAAIAAANKYGIPPQIFLGLISQESQWDPAKPGQAQANPNGTKDWGLTALNDKYHPGSPGFDINRQIDEGASTLKGFYNQYGQDWTKALSAYNTGDPQNGVSNGYVGKVMGYANAIQGGTAAVLGTNQPVSLSSLGSASPSIPGGLSDLGAPGSTINPWSILGAIPGLGPAIGSAKNIVEGDDPFWGTIKGIAETKNPVQEAIQDKVGDVATGATNDVMGKLKEYAIPIAVVLIGAVVIIGAIGSSFGGGGATTVNLVKGSK